MSTAARIDELRKKFEENPRRFFAPLANELRKAGDLTQAIALCREHLPKQPGHMSGYIVFGQALYESGVLDEARVVFEQALALDPENLIALHHLGHIARQVGDNGAARRWYERALETDPRNDDIAHQLAMLATPVRPVAAIPTPPVAAPAIAPSAPTQTPPATASFDFLDLGSIPARTDLGAIATPPFAQNAIEDLPLAPTPDAAMRAVDFDQVNASLRNPESRALFDLEAIESVGHRIGQEPELAPSAEQASAAPAHNEPIDISFDEPTAELTADMAAEPAQPETADFATLEDPFCFDGEAEQIDADNAVTEPVEAISESDLAVEFEEGLVAADWPDTTEFTARSLTPRSLTTLSVSVTPEAVEAFGREPQDPVLAPLPTPEPEVLGDDADLVVSEHIAAAEVEALEFVPDVDEGEEGVEAFAVEAMDEVDDVVSAADPREELPWLAAAGTPTDDMAAIVQAMEADARASGESDDVVIDEASETFAAADVEPAPAFVTETMGELLVAQGFVERAVVVYEELVRRRPYDPVLSARLAELQEQSVTAIPVSVYTARERFASLAARRVPRRTPPRAKTPVVSAVVTPAFTPAQSGTPVSSPVQSATPAFTAAQSATPAFTPVPSPTPVFASPHPTPVRSATPLQVPVVDSLSTLFGATAAPQDDEAAQALAEAFAPMQLEAAAVVDQYADSLFGDTATPREPTPAYGAHRQPTPIRASAVATPLNAPAISNGAEFSFDRFFPDPAAAQGTPSAGMPAMESSAPVEPTAKTSDDLAQFSAWLKGLGNA